MIGRVVRRHETDRKAKKANCAPGSGSGSGLLDALLSLPHNLGLGIDDNRILSVDWNLVVAVTVLCSLLGQYI